MTNLDPPAQVISIHLGPTAGVPLDSVAEAQAVAGQGLEGDRYFLAAGTFTKAVPGPDGELTLIERERISEFAARSGIAIQPADLRRNIVTAGVSLNDLVDREFYLGSVRIRGIRLCEPCQHLAELTSSEVLTGLLHRAGLRAQILQGGIIRVGDRIQIAQPVS